MHRRSSSLWPTLLAALGYLAIGVVFGVLARDAGPGPARGRWRLAAFVVSAALFVTHVRLEVMRRTEAPRAGAGRAALAVALGALALAAVGPARTHGLRSGRVWAALVVWPAVLAVPAFLVAWGLASGFVRWRRPA